MNFIVCVTFVFLCAPVFSRSKAVDKSEKKEKDPEKRSVVKCADKCYVKYFALQKVPTGLEISNPSAMSCICQKDGSGNDYFATYFDNNAGIAAYSAYTIESSDAKLIGTNKRPQVSWRTTPGIAKQGTTALYYGSSQHEIDKGHLNPSLINSYDKNHQIQTFTYTNAVPQFKSHNRRNWKDFEGRIANYVKNVCGKAGGNMHLITGTSNYLFDSTTGLQVTGATIELFPPKDPNGIVRPNSLWTAGCCVVPATSAQSIAVWGNNDKVDAETMSLSLTDLEKLLVTSPSSPANLFPVFPGCRANFYPNLDALNSVIQ